MAIDDEDFFAAVARHFVGGFLEELQLEIAAIGDGAGLVFGFKNLAEIIFGKYDRVFLFGGVQRCVADVEEIGAKGQMWAVLFENAEGEKADAF